jgi:Ca-activated chloride channel family protein
MDLLDLNWWPSGFKYPVVLWLEVIPVCLLFWIWVRRGRGVPMPFDFSQHGRGGYTKSLINLAESTAPILLAIVVWILACPMQLGKPESKRAITNIQFCVDVSGSMNAQFGAGNRYQASMNAIKQFVDLRAGDAFGLSFFGNSVLHWAPLTTDPSAIKCALPFMEPRKIPIWFGGTEIGKALLECRQVLMLEEEGDRMIILVSDGSSSDLAGGNADDIARRMVNAGITVYAIHIAEGNPQSEIVSITSKTGGDVFAPGDESALADVFSKIDSMEKTELAQTVAEQLDNFKPYSIVGLVILGLLALFSFGLRYTPW